MAEWETSRGYSGAAFDQHVGRTEQSPLQKVKEQFWTAKQVVLQKLGKKEDNHLVASDAELDAKLELFNSIKFSSGSLMRTASRYQKVMHEISKEEYAMGMFLKRHGEQDPSRAGIMLQNTAKAFVISAQKRMEARAPLIRLAQDTLTYRRCAVTDTDRKISQMEETRTEYRGALLWMKNVSEELDPDTYKQLEKFRKVQSQVRLKKERFDSQKLDTLQKIDLLAISRLNMLSQSLSPYGSTLVDFYQKVATVFGSVVVPVNRNADEAEQRILKANMTGQSSSGIKPAGSVKSSSETGVDDSLLDLSPDLLADGDPSPTAATSSELLDALWKESGLDTNNFDPLSGAMDGMSMDASDMPDKKDSPDGAPAPGSSLFEFSELDDAEKGGLDFFGDTLQPTKAMTAEKAPTNTRSFLPSQLLKKGWQAAQSSPTTPPKYDLPTAKDTTKSKDKPVTASNPHQAWYNLFADLDPLSSANQEVCKRLDDKEHVGSSC